MIFIGGTPGFMPSGMVKNGSTFSLTTTYQQITGWIADATYPGSSVASDALVVQSASSSATVAANIPFTSQFATTVTLQLFNGATLIAQGAASASTTSGTAIVSVSGVTIASGDLITVKGTTNSGFGATVTAGTGTWVRVTAP
ncbi:hypothetical protein [Nocardia africana]